MRNLIIDTGNSGTKLALYENGTQVAFSRKRNLAAGSLRKFNSGRRVNNIIVSSVRGIPVVVNEYARESGAELLVLDHSTVLPFSIGYESPSTLGTDRIAAVAGAFMLFPGENVLIIDAGTAITFDILEKNIYHGGNISPGLRTRLRSLNMFTGRLPLVELSGDFNSPASNTREAILAGVVCGVVYEINEYIRTFEEKYDSLKVIVTGGEGTFLEERITGDFVHVPDLVLQGLNFILEYNAKQTR
ncbi:MAG TPA: type III pantothenate kinase [Bacteroidales bacterium]|nr:type III pantothenate kinase [Bacteroidales bacterium]